AAETSVVQMQVVSWTQNATDDVYAPTPELLATPPIFTLPPGGKQVVRIGLRRAPDPARELPYRLFLQEIPPPMPADFQGMRMTLRIGVPVFVAPLAKPNTDLHWSAASASDGVVTVGLANVGAAHVKIASLELIAPDASELSETKQVAAYVLPGQRREWSLKATRLVSTGSRIRIKARTDRNLDLTTELTVGAP
ncbi:MAG TPA: fimbria/pilus periplasmic chaperone, partial [Steroidobacteraceae bacterium]|nr:fimbria/pilus periplasmic chaperone [Steroidobacteraceae bacterium]